MPVPVTGPDGKPYQFPDGTTKDQAVAYFKKKGIGASAARPAAQPAGFLKRFGQATGVPTSREDLKAVQPTAGDLIGGPAFTAGKMALNYGKNLVREGSSAATEIKDAVKNVEGGQPVVPNAGKAAGAVTQLGLRGLLGPVGGNAVQTGGEDVAAKNYAGATGDLLGGIVDLLMLKGAAAPSEATTLNKLAFASGKGTTAPIQETLGDLRTTIAEHGAPQTVGDFLDTVNKTKDRMNTEAGAAMQPIAGSQTVPTAVSDRIKALITPNMDMTAAGRAEKSALLRASADFEKPWTYRQLDAERMAARARLRAFNAKNPVEQYAAKGASRNVAIDDAINKAIRETVYPAMDKAAGKPPGYFSVLKGRQSNLIDLEDSLHDRVSDLKDVAARTKGSPRLSSENISLYGHPGGGVGASVHSLQKILVRPNPLKQANRAVSKAFSPGSRVAQAGVANLPIHYLLQPPPDQPKKSVAAALQPVQ